ncbi:GDSL-type esterase/lipase family protein [Opitutus sp. ER46]|uniref:GDSL-type esterase/lipase family protein n=1 Tax=Opitutus sp. ER46 TaxID=2161864 RepID=UPI000D2F4C9C|nr:GDSL-type esterase/lipase family protein [Opitutus sp. ER46]PTX97899.1 GDSL family lipase [Opitutus sp. ER46]
MKQTTRLSLRVLGCVAILGVGALFTSCATQAPLPAASAAELALRDPARNSAINPVPRDEKWMKRHQGFVAAAAKGGVDLLFVGDSITDFWRNAPEKNGGRAVWDREFAPLHALNIGISADRTQHVLWRLRNGELNGIDPKVIVLMIGTNNTGFEKDKVTPRNTPAQAAEGVRAIVRELRQREPQAKILLLAIFPRNEGPLDAQRQQVNEINREIAQLHNGDTIRFLDINAKLLEPDGTLSRDIMPDLLHPGPKGYEIWAAAIKPAVLEMLGQK